ENAGRDEVVVEASPGLALINRQQAAWRELSAILGDGITQAYAAANDPALEPVLSFRTETRRAVQTAGARIGLAQTLLVLDASGAYRAVQTYRVDNTTEQFLEIELPEGAELWTVRVAGQPV